ncbi:solute carrier family 6 (neurotransmitter transporter) member 19 [Sarotherodon galilaeus]
MSIYCPTEFPTWPRHGSDFSGDSPVERCKLPDLSNSASGFISTYYNTTRSALPHCSSIVPGPPSLPQNTTFYCIAVPCCRGSVDENMSSDFYSRDALLEQGTIPLDIDNVHMLLQVEQEQIQKRTFTNWVNAQLAKRRPPCMVVDLFNDFRDGSKLLDLLEVMSGLHISRERGRGMFQHRSNIEKALSFLKKKSIKLVNIHIPDIIDGKPSIILGLIWTIILQYHIEELASSLTFDSRQSSMESLASLDTRSTFSSHSASSSPVPPRGSPLHHRFRVSAKKALLLWVREQCHKAGCSVNVKDFKASWRSGVVFLAILYALRPDLVDLSKARTRSNKQNLEEAFRIAEKELRIPRLLEPDDVDVRDPDEKSIMTYVAQFLQYSRDLPVPEEEMQTQYLTPSKSPSPINLPVYYTPAISASPLRQATPDRKAQEMTCWLVQAYDELLEGWDSTEGESYSERYNVFQTFLVSFNEQRRPIMPLLTAMRRTPKLSDEQRTLREAWDTLTEKLREYKVALDMSLPAPLDTVARWLLRTEEALAEEDGNPQDHGRAADEAREKHELLKACLEEMPQHVRTFQSFQNIDEYGNMMIPTDKMDELKRRFTSVRVTAKYHGIKLEYREHRHTVLDLLGQIRTKLRVWKRPYISSEAVRVLLQEWHELVNTQELPSMLETAIRKLKQISEKYSSKSALASDYQHVSQQVKQLEEDTAVVLEDVTTVKSRMGRVLSAWDSYSDSLSSLQAWLEQCSATHSHRPELTSTSMAEWGSRQAHLNEVGNFLIESTDPQTSRSLAEELRKVNMQWAEFVKKNTLENIGEPSEVTHVNPEDIRALIREGTLILKEPLDVMAGPLRTYRKRLQFIMRKIKDVDLDALASVPECPADQLQKLKLAVPEVMQTLSEAEKVCVELQHSVSGLDSRLAELLHWETEARELYHLLRATDRQQKQVQTSQARVTISRGLQLEGQVVTEEQDLQVIVSTNQKSSPIHYLHASAMQDRVRAAVAQSQEAVGMLSSLGARRDRSRSPPAGPPSKVFIQDKAVPQHLKQSDTKHTKTFVPRIVVQDYKEEKMTSPPMPYTYAEAVKQTRRKSPPESQFQAWPMATAQMTTETPDQGPQQDLLQEGLRRQVEIKLGQKEQEEMKEEYLLQEVQQQELFPAQPQPSQPKQEQQQVQQQQVQQHVVVNIQVEQQVKQRPESKDQTPLHKPAVKKKVLSSQELQSRKAQGMKNRPWLQKPAFPEQKTPTEEQDSTQDLVQTRQTQSVGSVQVISQNVATTRLQYEAHAKITKQPQQQQKVEQKQTQQTENLEHQQQDKLLHQQQQKEQHQQKEQQKQQPQETVRQAQQESNTKNKSQTVTLSQPQPQRKAQNQSQTNTMVQSHTTTDTQQPCVPRSHDSVKKQSSTKPQTQQQLQPQDQALVQPAGPQPSKQPQVLPHDQSVAQVPIWAQIRQPSTIQAPLQGPIQLPVPSHIQLRSHPQSWAPVRPPSPKPPTQAQPPMHTQSTNVGQTHAKSMDDPEIHPQPKVQPQTHPQPKTQVQIHADQSETHSQSMPYPQAHAQSMTHVPTNVQAMARLSQAQPLTQHPTQAQPILHLHGHSLTDPMTQYPTHAQALVQQQGHISQGHFQAYTQVRSSVPQSIQHPQATVQPQLYSQGYAQAQSTSQQWIDKQEPQNQAFPQQSHPIPQPYPQQMSQATHSQGYPTVQTLSHWTQQTPQIAHHRVSHMGPSYTQPQMHPQAQPQPWTQTQQQIGPQSSMHQHTQMRASNLVQPQQGQVQQQTWVQPPLQVPSQSYQQPQSQQYVQVQHQPQAQHHPPPQIQTHISLQSQPSHQAYPQFPSQPQQQTLQAQSQTHVQAQPLVQEKPFARTQGAQSNIQFQQSTSQPKHQPQLQLQPMIQSQTQLKGNSPLQPRPLQPKQDVEMTPQLMVQSPIKHIPGSLPQPKPESQLPPQPKAQSLTKVNVETPAQSKVQAQPQLQPTAQSPTQPIVQSPVQPKVQPVFQPKSQAQLSPQHHPQVPVSSSPTAQTVPQSKTQSPAQARPQTQPLNPPKTETQSPLQQKSQQSQTILVSQVNVLPQTQAESPDLNIKPPALAQAPPQAYTEAYTKAQALARNGFEEAKHCLQAHILEAINVFKDRRVSAEQASVKEKTLRTLDPELLEEFLRAANGMEAFCTPSQLRDMEFFTQSVRTQWEACFSADFAEAEQHLQALKELCDTLSPEDAHRLAQTQLRECEKRLAAIQHQFSGDQDAPLPESRIPVAFTEDPNTQKEPAKPSDKPQALAEVTQVTVKTVAVERREAEKQTSVEEEVTKKEALERYENAKRALQAQLAKNEQSIKDVPSDSVSLKGLHTRLQEIQFLRQETECLWSEYANQCSQCSQLSGNTSLEQEKAELQEQWRTQQSNLQRRGSSLGSALRQIDSTENHMVDFTDRLDRYLRQPKDITGFTLANTNILKDIKELDDNIQSELDQLSRLDPESSDLDPRERFPLSREFEAHKTSLDQLRQQVRKSEAAARALDRFLMSLRTVDEDISSIPGPPCSDTVVLQECRSKLALIRQSIDSLKEKAPQLDLLLQGARLTVTRDGIPASCLDMVNVLVRRLDEADSGLVSQQKVLQKETQSKTLGLRKRTMLGEMKKLHDTIEAQGLKEPTMPALQHRLRALSDLEGQLQAQDCELQSLREVQEKQGGGENLLQELEAQWKETQQAFSDRRKQYSTLLELLKKFQTCRSLLSSTIQKAEQAISDKASYMGKDNLQRSMAKVCDIKEELAGLAGPMEEMKSVCKQLQSQLKKFPDCSESPFEAEADTLMDSWLDVTEKTDAYMDNLRVGLELWEKQLMLGGEVDSWAGAKLALFAESHAFYNEQQVLTMKDEIQANEENITHFHKKSIEIQEMLQSQEAPLELQVMETQLRKRMEQVKELFTDCTDVFEELIAVKKHLAEKVEDCQTAVENIQSRINEINASGPNVEAQIQDLCNDLESQEEQAEAVFKEVGLVSSVASPQVLEALSVDCSRLTEAISRTKDMIQLKREERDKGLLKVIGDEKQSFEEWFQDLQLAVNECFENPESRTDVETFLQRLASFLKSKDAERRLDQLKDQLERGSEQVPPQQLSEFTGWMQEQQEEVVTFRTHCQTRQKQMESLLSDLDSLQKQHDSLRQWLQNKEKLSVVPEKVKQLLKDLQDESGRAETLSELLASIRRQGVRSEILLKDADNLIQRYRNLEGRMLNQAEAQSVLDGEYNVFNTQAESTRTWISDLSQPLTTPDRDTNMEEMKSKAQAILSCKPEGDFKVSSLRQQSESLCEKEGLDESRKQSVQLLVRDTEKQWTTAVQAAQEALRKAETQAILEKDVEAFQTHNESVQSWIRDQDQNLKSIGGHAQAEEKLQAAQAFLSSKPNGESKLQELKQLCQSLCDNQSLDESRKQELHDTVKHTEEQWRKALQGAEEALKQAETEEATKRDFDAFKTQSETIQSWIKEQKQKLLSLGSHMHFEERSQIVQAVMTSKPEGESQLLDLKRRGENLSKLLEDSRKLEVQQLVTVTEQQWTTVQQAVKQAEVRSLSDDFDVQSKNTEMWIKEKQQKLQAVGSHTTAEERCHTAQDLLTLRPEGDSKVNNLRRRGQSLCDHKDADEGRKEQVKQTVRDVEELWRAALQDAKQLEAAAEAEIAQETERRRLELQEFNTCQRETDGWLKDLQQQLNSFGSEVENRLHVAQAIMNFKLQNLKIKAQSLLDHEYDEHKKQEIQQKVRDTEERWIRLQKDAKEVMVLAERQRALDGQLQDFEATREKTTVWLEEKQQSLVSLSSQKDPEQIISTAQTILSCKPEGDSKLEELKRLSQSLSDQEDLAETVRQKALQAVKDSEEQWRTVLETAENTLQKAEVQYSLSKELGAFHAHAGSTKAWITGLQKQADSMGMSTQGSKAQLQDRLSTAQAILRSKSSGETQLLELKRRAQSLCDHKDLEKDKKLEVQQTVRDTEEQWGAVLQAAEETQSKLQSVVERLVSCQYQRDQAAARLAELQKQTSNLPRVFPWPGLGERRQAVEQARALVDQITALAPVLSNVRTQAAELVEITQDQSWSDPTWTAKEESIPALLKELTDAVANLEQGIVTERQCTQLVEQHEAAQDWLREQVKSLGPPPADRQSLHSAVNTLKALLQTVDREQREMKELDSARDSLLSLCTPGGQDALTLEVSHLHDLCSVSEQEVREHLRACDTQLKELDSQLAKRTQGLKEGIAALQWELRSLDQALSYSEPQNNIAQLEQHWHSLQNCEKSLEDSGVKIHDLQQEVNLASSTNELPAEIISGVDSLWEQHASLKSRLSEHQVTCCTNTATCLRDCLHVLQKWNHSKPSASLSSVQEMLEEGEKLQASLQEDLSHRHFLMACLTLDLLEELEKDGSEALREADTLKISLSQSLKELNQRSKQKLPDNQSSDNLQETTTSVVAPPRKSKRSSEKKTVYPVSASASVAIQSYTTSQEPQSKTVRLDITDEPVTNEANKPASEDPTVMHKVTEETHAVTEETEIEQLYAENKTKDEAENKQKPSSEKSPVTGKQTKLAVEKSEIIQKGKKSKSFEVSQLAEPMFPLEKVASMQSTETKDESEKYNWHRHNPRKSLKIRHHRQFRRLSKNQVNKKLKVKSQIYMKI